MPNSVRFGAYEVDLPAGQLHKRGIKISLRDKSFQVLVALLEHPGEVVTREALRHQLWPDEVFVDFDNNLNTAIARLREALCDSADHPRFIETLELWQRHQHQYRWFAIREKLALDVAEPKFGLVRSATNAAPLPEPKARAVG